MRIILTGGGTGGHLYPLIAVAKKIREIGEAGTEILYIGSGKPFEQQAMEKESIKVKNVLAGKHRRYFSLANFLDYFKAPIGLLQALWILLFSMPDAVFSKGGYASAPVVVAAWLYRIPVMIHESDAVPGLANQMLSKFVKRIAVSYPQAEEYFTKGDVVITGIPLRPEINQGDAWGVYSKYSFTESKPVILVLGGSQGSKTINEAVIRILPRLIEYFQVIHQTGEKNFEETMKLAGEMGVKNNHGGYAAVKFLEADELKNCYAAASMIVSRAGATTIAEIAANKKAAILIPLKSAANDHQRMNAYALAKVGAVYVIEEEDLGQNLLFDKINMFFKDESMRTNMEEKIGAFYHPDSAEKIVKGLLELAE